SHPPRFVRAAINLTPAQQMALTWQVESESDTEVWVQWTIDRGERWHGLAVGLRGGEALLPLTGLPAGRVGVRLLAHDGFFTAESEVLAVDLPERAPEVAILYPRNGHTLRLSQPIQVSGNATDTAGNPLPAERLTWALNGRVIGRGRELWLTPPNAGRHELTLEVDWKEGKARSVVVFNTEDISGRADGRGL
ncbi:MAG: hypothetical protein M3430_14275, partial [Acidobacteriota bacterium]|nr:hypothetical protein [Acidobacteriota bacterium]